MQADLDFGLLPWDLEDCLPPFELFPDAVAESTEMNSIEQTSNALASIRFRFFMVVMLLVSLTYPSSEPKAPVRSGVHVLTA